MTAADLRGTYSALRRFARREATPEPCELCNVPLGERHDHLLEPSTRRIACACRACALLFPEGATARYRRLVSRARPLASAALTDADFATLGIPVRLFFLCPSLFHDTVFAVYPNVAGATEATIPLPAWDALVRRRPSLGEVEPEVDALFCDHLGGRSRAFVASLDVCRHFVGLVGQSRSLEHALRFLDGLGGGAA